MNANEHDDRDPTGPASADSPSRYVVDPGSVPAARDSAVGIGDGRDVPDTPSSTAPAVNPPRWSGRKTAVAAALAIGFTSVGTVAAAAALPQGTGADTGGPGGRGPGRFGPHVPAQDGQQARFGGP